MDARKRKRWVDMFLEVGIWILFFALLVPAGFVGYEVGRATSSHDPAPPAHTQTQTRR